MQWLKYVEHYKLYLWVENHTFYNLKGLDIAKSSFLFNYIFSTQIAKI